MECQAWIWAYIWAIQMGGHPNMARQPVGEAEWLRMQLQVAAAETR